MKWPYAIGLLLLFLPARAGAREYRLRPDGSGDLPTIVAAIARAADGDTITLAAGTYRGESNRDLDFGGKDLVLRAVTATADSCVIDCLGRGRGFCLHSEEPATSRVVGITIRGGLAEEGGAVLAEGRARTEFLRCVFRDNRARTTGGAVSAKGGLLRFTGCAFFGNTAGVRGGAAYLWSCSYLQFDNCSVVDNTAPEGSGLSCVGLSELHLTRCLVAFNGPGEGVQCRAGVSCGPRVEQTDIFGNEGGDWRDGLLDLDAAGGNMTRDPLFVAPRSPGYRLRADSPCRTDSGWIGVPGGGGPDCPAAPTPTP